MKGLESFDMLGYVTSKRLELAIIGLPEVPQLWMFAQESRTAQSLWCKSFRP